MPEFSSTNQGTWFFYDPNNEDLGGVCLRELTLDEAERIEKLTIKRRKKFKRGVAYDDIQTDKKLASKMRWDFCITDWKETSLDGRELECTAENKVKMMKVTDFVKHVVDSLEVLVEANATLDEARAKNLPTLLNGNSEEVNSETVTNV